MSTVHIVVLGQFSPKKIAPRTIAPETIALEENYPLKNCPLTIKFLPKIIASTLANVPQRVLRVN